MRTSRVTVRHADMKKSKRSLWVALGVVLLLGGAAVAQPPKLNINPNRHPNLAAAQDFSKQAWDRIVQAQKANDWDMSGHAQKAKELLEAVNIELSRAAEAANNK
jgi:hypothetical protein